MEVDARAFYLFSNHFFFFQNKMLLNFTGKHIRLWNKENSWTILPPSGCLKISQENSQVKIRKLSNKYGINIFTPPELENIVGFPEEWLPPRGVRESEEDNDINEYENRKSIIVAEEVARCLKAHLYIGDGILDKYRILYVFYPDESRESIVTDETDMQVGIRRLCYSCGGCTSDDEKDKEILNFLMGACKYAGLQEA